MRPSPRLALCAGVTSVALLAGAGAVYASNRSTPSGVSAQRIARIAPAMGNASGSVQTASIDSEGSAEPTSTTAAPTESSSSEPSSSEVCVSINGGDISLDAEDFPFHDFPFDEGDFPFDEGDFPFDEGMEMPEGWDIPQDGEFPEGWDFPEGFDMDFSIDVSTSDGETNVSINGEIFEGGPGSVGFPLDTQFPDEWDIDLPDELVAEMQAHSDGLRAALEAAGIAVTTVEGPDGLQLVDWDHSDPAANAVAEAYIEENFTDITISFDCDASTDSELPVEPPAEPAVTTTES
jgi:hypothetical protein